MAYSLGKRKQSLKKSKSIEVELTIEDLPVLRRKRTLAINRLKKALSIGRLSKTDSDQANTFLAYFPEVKKLVSSFEAAHDDIVSLLDSDTEDLLRSEFDEIHLEILSIYRQLTTKTCSDLNTSSESSNVKSKNIKLPKVNIPTFDGNIKTWSHFYDVFNSLVHHNDSLSDSERVHYLMSCLSGEALTLVRAYPCEGTYYAEAYQSLVDRYKNKRELAFTCWKEILNINLKTDSPTEFRCALDLLKENLKVLERLDLPAQHWGFVLCYLILSKLDSSTRCAFEQEYPDSEIPVYEQLSSFLYSKCESIVRDSHFTQQDRALTDKSDKARVNTRQSHTYTPKKPVSTFLSSAIESKQFSKQSESISVNNDKVLNSTSPTSIPITKCSFCQQNHSIKSCDAFIKKSIEDRYNIAKVNRWCFNCLRPSHQLKDCKSIFSCQVCRQKHHTLLHKESSTAVIQSYVSTDRSEPSSTEPEPLTQAFTNMSSSSVVLLATANVEVRDSAGRFISLRALIDSGSQSHFITERALERLRVRPQPTSRDIHGLGQSSTTVSGVVNLELGVDGRVLFNVNALTLPAICGKMPTTRVNLSSCEHLRNLVLADPDCDKPGPVDMLIGAEIFSSILVPGSIPGGSDYPSALNTVFGYVILGNVQCNQASLNTRSFLVNETNLLHDEVKKMWELDSFPQAPSLAPSEQQCEDLFVENHTRDGSGRYIVSLPFREDSTNLHFPGSRENALRRFHSLERKLQSNPELHEQYSEFMLDYLKSGHMTQVSAKDFRSGKYYIPHHCVIRPNSLTTRLRVVFDASAKDARGRSLNDTVHIGPKLQTNIAELLLRFRIHPVVFTADIKQMFRNIGQNKADCVFQRIFWRFNKSEPIQEYELNTVTYGIASSPYLACRTIKQLVEDEGSNFPHAVDALTSSTYVDDVAHGSFSLDSAQSIKSDLINILKRGCFELRKWASNRKELLADLPADHCITGCVSMDVENTPTLKILGLKWEPSDDIFSFEVSPIDRTCTKRTILSEVARIYDPLGFLCPLTFIPKLLVQRLWISGIGWDDVPPTEVIRQWNQYVAELPSIKQIRIPRYVSIDSMESCEIHGFSDSSEVGYGAVVYIRMLDSHRRIHVSFLCAKSRVAPVKKTSLPRLELCSAVLLADLLKFVKQTYASFLSFTDTYAWSDSTITLAWIRSHSSRWKTFVANRVSHIHETVPDARWNHVRSGENPADIASRGMSPVDLLQSELWWTGPRWLRQSSSSWPLAPSLIADEIEVRAEERIVSFVVDDDINFIDSLLERFSSIRKVQRVVGYCLRFIRNSKCKQNRSSDHFLNHAELHTSLMTIAKRIQIIHFPEEIRKLKDGKLLPKSWRKLNPFIDSHGVLRVGGRLSRSGLEYNHKHPALIPRDSTFTYMVIEAIHREHCHPGLNTTQYLLTQQFWVFSSKRAIRHCLSKCIQCYKTKPSNLEPFMSDLPASRVNQVKPFSVVGVDYGGPFQIKLGKHRGAKIGKAYLCLFICFSTKAVHLEVVSELSADAFIAALRRFVGRRGRVNVIHSDCGTNFVGAQKILDSYAHAASQSQNIEFKFNPPAASHFGGVWEIQIRAAKTHLHRIIGNQTLTFEELTTLFVQIEAMLNSRPLYPLSSDPNDMNVLTPGHFLVLEPLTAVSDSNCLDVNINRLSRWQLIQRFQQDFWNRWKTEYLSSLTQRAKWNKHDLILSEGSLVLIKSENTIPLHWPLARVSQLHVSPDGVVRIATVRTANGNTYTRPLVKLCPLPIQSD